MGIEIQQDMARIHALGLLERLLADQTTNSNILWATDAYAELGPEYQRDRTVEISLITGKHAGLIRNRAEKAMNQQTARTRQHGEVFTPLWVCNKMNNYADEVWFGRPDVFNKDGVPADKIAFPAKPKRQKTEPWMKYVDSRRLEITCGEAPYLVSRYDVSTGDAVALQNRIGILDRKLRVVNENAGSEEEWLKWAVRAYEATYGYESQGDNLLIARMNLLVTFEEYLKAMWDRAPVRKEYEQIIRIITWNLWQMDGLTGKIPYCKAGDECPQLTLFGSGGTEWIYEAAAAQPCCRIRDWRGNSVVEYVRMKQGGYERV